jgi:short-subunit dehydrogenase
MTNLPVAIISGASRGIGKACAVGLAKLGYQTCLIGREKETLKVVSDEIIENNLSEPYLISINLNDIHLIPGIIEDIFVKFGRIDVLVNNAGQSNNHSLDAGIDEFEAVINLNLTAPFALLKAVVPLMKERQHGYIFNIASRSGKIGFEGKGVYAASKFGLVGLTEVLYRELASDGISVTSICPGWVNTELAFEGGTPLKAEEMIQPEDIMETLQWLLRLSAKACVKEVVLESFFSIH